MLGCNRSWPLSLRFLKDGLATELLRESCKGSQFLAHLSKLHGVLICIAFYGSVRSLDLTENGENKWGKIIIDREAGR